MVSVTFSDPMDQIAYDALKKQRRAHIMVVRDLGNMAIFICIDTLLKLGIISASFQYPNNDAEVKPDLNLLWKILLVHHSTILRRLLYQSLEKKNM